MSSPLTILFLASQLTAAAPDKVPAFDIVHTCQTEGTSVVAPERCTQDEGKARDQVQTEWSQFAAADKATCTKTTSVNRHWNGTPDRHPKGTPLIGES